MALAPLFVIGLSYTVWRAIFVVEMWQKRRERRQLLSQQESVRIAPETSVEVETPQKLKKQESLGSWVTENNLRTSTNALQAKKE